MHLYLVRHPRPIVAANTCYGSTDLEVTAEELALAHASLLPVLPKKAVLFSSPLRRCRELSASLAETLGCQAPTYDERLAEMHFGDWEMRSWDDIPRASVNAWSNDMVAYQPGGGESVLQVAQRVRAFRDELSGLNIEHAIVICHAGIIRLLAACEHGLSIPEMALYAAQKPHKIRYGELLVVDC
ncbi:histidine phosphatase family protein [Herminiimonas fonticola]|uniref:Alpha-ribazole phosphatase n=1 Tax=Herminiimonas fonticola TaxID=303380 RepID=A0A4R6G7U6_9BURK|nr:histidine phosphatase family protein [Herminiimonas fonticola]RBA23864.1 Fructose-26-bisphosphatase [Herminiimonas fonticola]TDN89864.1 alpha-ribazole phosphatase [Herminiimonas fonticola]